MNASKPLKSFVASRFPRVVAAYRDARHVLKRSSLEKVFSEIYHTNGWRDPESVSGRGSILAKTKVIMSHLPSLLQELRAESLLDAACGDFNWMRYVELGPVKYIGVDVVSDLISRNQALYQDELKMFVALDIAREPLPQADVILCRDCLIHLSFRSINAVLSNLRRTSATHLLCTTHTTVNENVDCPDGSWRNLNLQLPPFNFPEPAKLIIEDCELGKCLGVWRVKDL